MNRTHILDTLLDADGNPALGRIVISYPAFVAADGSYIVAGSLMYEIPAENPGLVDISLAPTEGTDPEGVAYEANYFLAHGANYTERWNVPLVDPESSVTISNVRGDS